MMVSLSAFIWSIQSVWSPHLRKHINMLENAQILALKLVDGLGTLKYPERLEPTNSCI